MSAVVLVVDDDPVQRRLIENMVQRFGYKALTADGGDAAAKLLCGPEGERIDCVILDLVMPDLDGLGVLARMKVQLDELSRPPAQPTEHTVKCPCIWKAEGESARPVAIPRYNNENRWYIEKYQSIVSLFE